MAEVTRVLGRMQLDTEGGLVPASGSEGLVLESSSVPFYSRRRSKLVKGAIKGDSAAVGATKPGRKMAVAKNTAVGSFAGEICVTNAEMGNKEAAGTFTGEIGVTKAELGNKEAAWTGMVKAASCSDVVGTKPAAGRYPEPKEERKAEPAVAIDQEPKEECKAEPAVAILKERVPQSFIDRIQKDPIPRPRPLPERYHTDEDVMFNYARINAMVDLEQDCLAQYKNKGYAEVGVNFTDGVKTIFRLGKAGMASTL